MAKSKKRSSGNVMSHATYMHHVAWGIVCALLLAVIVGLLAYAQSLASDNAILSKELRETVATRSTCKVNGTWTADTTRQLSLKSGKLQRGFLVHTPKGFIDGQYYPLVFYYTGKGATAVASEAAMGLDGLPAIVVYPFPTIGKDGALAWEGAPYSSGSDDVAFTAAILDKVEADLCIDRTRVYATGFSNGGGFASLLSCKLSDRFAAYAIDAAALYYPSGGCTPPRPVSLISIHGDNDSVIPYNGSTKRALPPIGNWIEMRAKESGCQNADTAFPNISTIITTWRSCKDGSVIQNIRIAGGEHAWGMVSNDQLWQFLSKFSR